MNTTSKRQTIIDDDLKDQILAVRDTGRTNMFMILSVQRIAYEMELFDLAVFLEDKENRKAYVDFIMSGKC